MTGNLKDVNITRNRYIWNIWMFIISFTLSNFVSGIIYDTYVNYLQEVARPVATSFWSYYGYATFISAIMVLLVNKIGYKRILLFCPLTSFGALIAILYLDIPILYQIMTVLALVGLQLHYAILGPYIAAYTTSENKTLWYSRTYWIGYIGWAFTTYLGGYLTVLRFANRINGNFSEAQNLTKYIDSLAPNLKSLYIKANGDVLLLTAIVAGISLIPVLLIREKREDYKSLDTKNKESIKDKARTIFRAIVNKYALAYVIYWALINFGMGLFTPYYTVFLNRNLHIDRSTASLLVSISYLAMVLFIMFTPKVVKKLGQIVTLAGVLLLSIPFMMIIANGDKFGKFMIPVVGIALFIRSGLANLGSPIDSSLPMEIVKKEIRPAMSSIINIVAGLMSIVSGKFTGDYLFVNQAGYKTGYYIAAGLYVVGSIILLLVFMKNYNRPREEESSAN
ncbi:MFS transporter [Anaerosalibacter bizertensis]|uniref:MFS transporter n=1 Tax=Anaerosalibacter bizertensis TaxID=932217 RepID=UPI001C0F331D|nr:MFS transporter [Anaerosalibacter bizertensis]MBU5294282.1 MFS transporter [Anaerosalibacter bizertensis]